EEFKNRLKRIFSAKRTDRIITAIRSQVETDWKPKKKEVVPF
ncbi:hypothetical protein MHK_001011, partial [Candidatus Magnetomorum sp. HK-1]